MICISAAYLSGSFFASFFTEGSVILLASVLFPLLLTVALLNTGGKLKYILVSVVTFCLAAFSFAGYKAVVNKDILSLEGKTVGFGGEVTDITLYDRDKAMYTLRGNTDEGSLKVYLNLYCDDTGARIGDRIDVENCVLRTYENDYLYNSRDYYGSRRIFLSSNEYDGLKLSQRNGHYIKRALLDYREKMISEFNIKLGRTGGSFLSGIVFGDRSGMEETDKEFMYRCGIGHVMAVSGLHASVFAALIMFILSRFHAGKLLTLTITDIFLIFMIIIVKSPVSVIRAAIMFNFYYIAKLFRRQGDPFNSLGAAALLICIFNPYAIKDVGFILSVFGTFAVGTAAPALTSFIRSEKPAGRLLKEIVSMIFVMLLLMPLNIYYFHDSSLVSFLTNVFILPLCMAVMLIGGLYVLSGGFISLLSPAGLLIDFISGITEFIGRLEFVHFSGASPVLFCVCSVCVYGSAAVYILSGKKIRSTVLSMTGGVAVFATIACVSQNISRDRLRVAVLGEGEDKAVVVSLKGNTTVFDISGDRRTPEYVRKYLSDNGISEIDAVSFSKEKNRKLSSYSEELELSDIKNFVLCGDDDDIASVNRDNIIITPLPAEFKNNNFVVKYSGENTEISYYNENILSVGVKDKNIGISYYPEKNNNVTLQGTKDNPTGNTEIIFDSEDRKFMLRRLDNVLR